jgi:erythrin-vacuolar iron transport family protein
VGTFIGGILHTLPFLIPRFEAAIVLAAIVVAFELVALAYLRWRFFQTSFVGSLGYVTLAGLVIAGVSAGLGASG